MDFHEMPEGLEADVCIVGAGTTGLALADALRNSPGRIVVVESGTERQTESASPDLREGDNIGPNVLELVASRAHGLGGTSQLWAGQCVPFDTEDFDERPWVPGARWPYPRTRLEPFYRRAEELFGLGPESYDEVTLARQGVDVPALRPELLRHRCTAYPPEVNVARLTRSRLRDASRVTIVLGAHVTGIILDPDGRRAGGVCVRSPAGREDRVRARRVVLCAGGIENPRLLLASREHRERGLGNEHDQVGRWLQDHPNALVATIATEHPRPLQDRYGMLYARRRRYLPRIALAEELQRHAEVVQAAAVVSFEFPAESAVEKLRGVVRGDRSRRELARLSAELPTLARVAWRRYARGRSPAIVPARVRLQVFTEQVPDAGRRVTLGADRDALGVPRAQVHWGVARREEKAARTLVDAIGQEFARLGLGQVEPDAWFVEGDTSRWRDAYHHIGTTRMATDATRGVVDEHGEVHSVPGLHVAGSSTFPSSSWANPVLTAVATTLKLGDRLAAELRADRVPATA